MDPPSAPRQIHRDVNREINQGQKKAAQLQCCKLSGF